MKIHWKILFFGLTFLAFSVSCDYNKTSFDIESFFEPTLDFSKTSEFVFDENFVEVKDGKAQLKALDLEHRGEDFNNFSHVGTSLGVNNQVTIPYHLSTSTDLRNILPHRNPSLFGYWKFENNFEDSSTNHFELIPVGDSSTGVAGKVGAKALSLDGTGDYLYMDYDPRLDIGSTFSISGWVRLSAPPTHFDPVISRGYTIGPPYYVPYFVDFRSNQLCGGTHDSSNTDPEVVCGNLDVSTRLNEWIHFLFVKNDGNYKMYLDGVLDNEVNGAINANLPSVEGLAIGTLQNLLTRDAFIEIDELAIWQEALDSAEVWKVFENQNLQFTELAPSWTPKYDNIVGYWKMDGNWLDSSGNESHGVPAGDATLTLDSKVGAGSASFDGTGNTVLAAVGGTIANGVLSWGGWLKSSQDHATFSNLVFFEKPFSSHIAPFYDFSISYSKTTNKYLCTANIDGTQFGVSSAALSKIADNTWRHLFCTYDGENLNIFLNGKFSGQTNASGTLRITPGTDISFGAHGNVGNEQFYGSLDDISIWQTALTSLDVSKIYHRQKQKYAGHFDSEVMDLGSSTSNWPDLSWSTNLPFGKELIGDFNGDGQPDPNRSADYLELTGQIENGLIGHWGFNETAENSIVGGLDFYDSSGAGNHAIESGGVTFNRRGMLGSAIQVDGADDSVNMNTFIPTIEGYNNGTISTWFKTSDSSSQTLFNFSEAATDDHALLFGVGPWTSDFTDESVLFAFKRNNLLRLRFVVREGHEKYLDGRWHHIAVRIDGVDNTIFVDGVKKTVSYTHGSSSTSEFSVIPDADTAHVAARYRFGSVNNYFNGQVDEFSIWNRALSDSEVQQLYRRGANRIKFQVKSCVDSSCECKSFNLSPAGSATDCDGDTIVNSLDFDDIHKAEFIGPGGDGTTYYSEAFNRKSTDLSFNCGNNISDSDGNICVDDEITFNSGPKPTSPSINFSNFPLAARPADNQYFQYRAYMEADDNSACDGSPCLPELSSVQLGSVNEAIYNGSVQTVRSTQPISFQTINSAKVIADSCVSFQLSPDGTNYYYWLSNTWALAQTESQSTSLSDFENYISSYSEQFGPGELYIKALLQTNSNQSSNCSIQSIDLDYSN